MPAHILTEDGLNLITENGDLQLIVERGDGIDVDITSVRSLSPIRTVASLSPALSAGSLMPSRTVLHIS